MKSFECCVNCGVWTGGNKFCGNGCLQEYHNMNVRMTATALAVLEVLHDRRGWVILEYASTVYGLEHRIAPLLLVRSIPPTKRGTPMCKAIILPNGERWLKYHMAREGAA